MCVCVHVFVCMCVYKSVPDGGENIVGSCSPNMAQISRGKLPKLLLYTHMVFFRCLTNVPHWLKRCVYNKSFGSLPRDICGMFGLQLPTMFC